MKEQLKEGDILVFKNGHKKEYTHRESWTIEQFYDDDLNCITNDKFTIIKVLRPEYEVVYERKNNECNRRIKKCSR